MPLKMRPTGLGHGVYKDNVDYSVFCGEWCIGRIYETRTGPEQLRWFDAPMREIITIAPIGTEPGLIAYECSACSYVTNVIVPAEAESRDD